MTEKTGPRWVITYRRAGAEDYETLTIAADSMVTALKAAQMKLAELIEPYRISEIREATESDTGDALDIAQALRGMASSY